MYGPKPAVGRIFPPKGSGGRRRVNKQATRPNGVGSAPTPHPRAVQNKTVGSKGAIKHFRGDKDFSELLKTAGVLNDRVPVKFFRAASRGSGQPRSGNRQETFPDVVPFVSPRDYSSARPRPDRRSENSSEILIAGLVLTPAWRELLPPILTGAIAHTAISRQAAGPKTAPTTCPTSPACSSAAKDTSAG